jgi:acetyl-CoA C-acetyltransferase
MPVYPYRKLMMASPNVNLAAAVIVASAAKAHDLAVPVDRRVHLRGWSAADDFPFVAENEDLARSPAMEAASADALASAGMTVDDLTHVDLYSCFPSAIRFGADALGLPIDDQRGLTVTGGMPYAGAPGSGYVTHAVATMTGVLRDNPAAAGLVSGLTAQMAGHVFAVYSATPGPVRPPNHGGVRLRLGRRRRVTIRDCPRGPAVIASYAVACSRAGDAELGVAVCDLPDGSRCYAEVRDEALLRWMSGSEAVGSAVELGDGPDGRNQVHGCS